MWQKCLQLSLKNEIILTGSQSGLATYGTNSIAYYPLNHQIYLESIQPDVVILCINPYDELNFINKTINLINGLTSAKVIGAICFPQDIDESWMGKMGRKINITQSKRELLKSQMLSKFNLKLGFLDNYAELDSIIEDMLNYLANS
jgi:uncharacterized NAD-dependent epimerase/dehydratase family protein